MGWSLNKLPQPTDEDRALRSERVTLNGEQRRQLFKSYMPLLIMLFFANLFITILRDIKEDFLVNIIDVSTISFLVVRTSGRHGDADYFGNLCHDVVNKQQLQSIAGASGYGYWWSGHNRLSGF